jgi:hypothetical protein
MAFIIRIQNGVSPVELAGKIEHFLAHSRFFAEVRRSKFISIHNVRLRTKKHYCGNHPLPCPVRPGKKERHVKADFLEGADWVAFNDMLNDAMDLFETEADAGSSLVVIRQGFDRCVEYLSRAINFANEWQKFGIYRNCLHAKKRVRATYPPGTPGIDEWLENPNDYRRLVRLEPRLLAA